MAQEQLWGLNAQRKQVQLRKPGRSAEPISSLHAAASLQGESTFCAKLQNSSVSSPGKMLLPRALILFAAACSLAASNLGRLNGHAGLALCRFCKIYGRYAAEAALSTSKSILLTALR